MILAIVNPTRDVSADDDWAYAWTTQHLLETGDYQLHSWLAANMPFQACWGSLFCEVFGFSFTALRISTLTLVLLGLIAFFYLARAQGFDEKEPGILTLVLACSRSC